MEASTQKNYLYSFEKFVKYLNIKRIVTVNDNDMKRLCDQLANWHTALQKEKNKRKGIIAKDDRSKYLTNMSSVHHVFLIDPPTHLHFR